MSDRISVQYATLRYIHDPTTSEFLNIGLVLYAPAQGVFLGRVLTTYGRLAKAFPGMNGEVYRLFARRLQTLLDRVSAKIRGAQSLLFGGYPKLLSELLAPELVKDDTSISLGDVHSGLAKDARSLFRELYDDLVQRYLEADERASRTDDQVWTTFHGPLEERHLLQRLSKVEITTPYEVFSFDHGWKNGAWHVLAPVSFDLQQPGSIQKKAKEWVGAAVQLEKSQELSRVYLLLGAPRNDDPRIAKAYSNAFNMLSERSNGRLRLVEEKGASEFADEVRKELHPDV